MKLFLPACLLSFLCFNAIAQQQCNYTLKEGIKELKVYDLDRMAELVYDTSSIAAPAAYIIQSGWVLLPDTETDTSVFTHVDYEINADTMIRINVEIPLSALRCIENMDSLSKDAFTLSALKQMFTYFSTENEQHQKAGNISIELQDYSAETRSFFYHEFYWVEGYLGGDIIIGKTDTNLWYQYLYTISNDVWGNSGEGRIRIASLLAARPDLFVAAFEKITREQNRNYILGGVRNYFRNYLLKPGVRFENSAVNNLFKQYADMGPRQRAHIILDFYKPYLLSIGLEEKDIKELRDRI